jgi:hypothetical protein
MARIRERCGVKDGKMRSLATRSMQRRTRVLGIAGTEMGRLRGGQRRIVSGRVAMV